MANNNLLAYRVNHLTKRYPRQEKAALDDVSFEVAEHEIFGVLGENGAGKSTLVRQMVGLLRSTSGTVEVFGKRVEQNRDDVALLVGYMPQQIDALNRLTVGEALYFTAHLRGLSRADAKRERDTLLEIWGLGNLRDRDNAFLSGGQRRLLRIAVAMAGSPPVLVLDEPTNDLDPLRRRLVWDVLRNLNAQEGATIVFITHDAVEAEKVIERVGIMRDGRFVALGRPAELKKSLRSGLRLSLRFSPDHPPASMTGLHFERRDPDSWIVLAEWTDALKLLDSLNTEHLDSVSLSSPTLEDLYLHYVTET